MADDYVMFRLSNKNILMNVDPLDPSAGTIPDVKKMGDFSRILNQMENKIRSATGEAGFKFNRNLRYTDPSRNYQYQDVVVQKEFYNTVIDVLKGYEASLNIGSAGVDPITGDPIKNTYLAEANARNARLIEYTKTIKGKKAQASFLKEAQRAGGYAYADPTLKNPERMKAFIPVTEDEYNALATAYANKTGKKPETEIYKRTFTATEKESSYENRVRKAEAKEKEKAREEKEKEKEDKEKKESRRKTLRTVSTVVAIITIVLDVCRRILTATLARASEAREQSVTAHTMQVPTSVLKEFKFIEQASGMKEGTIEGAVSDVQKNFGDPTNPNEKALGTLARVMGGKVDDLVKSGMGNSDPYTLMKEIVDAFFTQAMSGKNSLGQNVGQAQAVREMTTVLQGVSPDLATFFSHMANENLYGAYKGMIKNSDDYMHLTTIVGTKEIVDLKNLSTLGTEVDELKSKFSQIKTYLAEDFLTSLRGLIKKINNWDIGKTYEQKVTETEEALALYRERAPEMEKLQKMQLSKIAGAIDASGIDYKSFGYKTSTEVVEALQNDTMPKELVQKLYTYMYSSEGKQLRTAVALHDKYVKYKYYAESQIQKGIAGKNISYDPSEWTSASIATGEAIKDNNIDSKFQVSKTLTLHGGEYEATISTANKEKLKNYNSLLGHKIGDYVYGISDQQNSTIVDEYEKAFIQRKITLEDLFTYGTLDRDVGNKLIRQVNDKLGLTGKDAIKEHISFGFNWKDKEIQRIAELFAEGKLTDDDLGAEFKKHAIQQNVYSNLWFKLQEGELSESKFSRFIETEAGRQDMTALLADLSTQLAGRNAQVYQKVTADAKNKQFTFSFIAKTPEGKVLSTKSIVLDDSDITTDYTKEIPFTVDFNKVTSDNSMTP
jgi:hypothetical protein